MLEASPAAQAALDGITVHWMVVRRVAAGGDPPAAGAQARGRELGAIAEAPVAQAYRELFWTMGIDPTKERPAGEALARRLARDGALPSILPVVDAYNLASARTLVPISAFDLEALELPLTLDLAEAGETFEPIGAEPAPVDEGRPVWRDQSGIVSLFLHRDGQRTAISETSQEIVLAVAGPTPLAPRVLPETLRVLDAYLDIVGWQVAKGPSVLKL